MIKPRKRIGAKFSGYYPTGGTSNVLRKVEGIQEIHWVRATPVSVLTFAIVDTKENFETISIKANQWREKFAFDIHDMLVFDGDLIESVRR